MLPGSALPRSGRRPYRERVLFLVRHGQTVANARGRLLGRSDPALTDLGRRQACGLAALLPRPARLVSSPLLRARQTAAALAPAGVEVEVDERWVELDYGELEGLPVSALPERMREDPECVPAGGESVAAVGARVRAACAELAAPAADADVVVVSHVSPIKAAVAWALGVGDEVAWRTFLADGAVCRIETAGRHPVLLSFSERPSTP